MTLKRTMDARFLNSVINNSEVRPWLGGSNALDVSDALADPKNIGLQNERGGFILMNHEPGVYEVHTQFLPGFGGLSALKAAREGIRYMFTKTDCHTLLTRVPVANRAALAFTAAVGWRRIFKREKAWLLPNGEMSDVHFFAYDLYDWQASDSATQRCGVWFHEKLEAAKREHGSVLDIHQDDDAHNRAVGASILMAQHGNYGKAVWAYNRWASHAGYAKISLLSEMPPVFDVLDAVVTLNDGDMEVLLCR